jgi:cellobiose phosphorylase
LEILKRNPLKVNPIQEILTSIGLSFPGNSLLQKYASEKPPLRAELFGADQMVHHGKSLASRHKLQSGRVSNILLKRLSENEEQLLEVHELLTEAVKTNKRIIPAGEWLLDNFYLILEQIQTGKKHLPKSYSEDLPLLMNGQSAGLPRVYDIAIEIISHSDGRIDLKNLGTFITAYQTITPLKLGELWAIPIMLRLALIENLRRLSTQIAFGRINQNLAEYWAEQMTTTAEKDPKNLILVIADMARSNPPMESAFVAELTRMLQGKGPALALPLNWIEQRLSETGQTSSELINGEIQKQATDQVSMSNSIGSLRFLGKVDWREFVESISIVEQILSKDVLYPEMDFSTRDSYRHVVEKIARYSKLSEQEVAHFAMHLAKNAALTHGDGDRRAHVGYYLVGRGSRFIEKSSKIALPLRDKFQDAVRCYPLPFYTGAIILMTLIIAAALTARVYLNGTSSWLLVAVAILSILSASHLAVTLVNWLTTLFIQPRQVPRMNYTKGINAGSRTLVIIPAMLNSVGQLESLLESLEVYFLANRDEYLHFGLLTDFPDAAAETLPEDEQILFWAREKIQDLNKKYTSRDNGIFFLFHRPRKWNRIDKIWMGYERKRGKLTDLNAILRGEGEDRFSLIVGNRKFFPGIKYVITIDSDTQLPRDSARSIIASMAHPLNKPHYDEKKQRVTEGYGILQPRVALSLTGSENSLYARLHGTDLGIDPYTRAVSDVYQDLFDEGSFIGKGIYDVDMFRKALDNRFPENRILSHDLLEGCILRSGFLSDIQMYEEYPSRYNADVKRRHRWIRGDWQIAAWALPLIPGLNKGLHKNTLSALSRWKIFDNLRRSLVPFALITLLIGGGTILNDGLFWSFIITGILLLPALIIAARDILHKPKDILLKQHFKDSIESILNNIYQTVFTLACLPYEAYFTVDAILRSFWRMVVSRKHLLEWNSSEDPGSELKQNIAESYRTMWIAPLMGLAGLVYLTVYKPISHIFADPILILWTCSPAIAWYLSRPLVSQKISLNGAQISFLRKLARKTWSYFEQFVTPMDNWLPPDNYQEHPVERIAHRTSPTNIGLSLMANLAAVDFGYITVGQFIERTTNTFNTLQKMERFKGHFYNWYDTITLQPLPPHYVSTVDSGNLAGQLLTLRQGILSMPNEPVLCMQLFRGVKDTVQILRSELKEKDSLREFQNSLNAILALEPLTLKTIHPLVTKLVADAERLFAESSDRTIQSPWFSALMAQCQQIQNEMSLVTSWLKLTPAPEKFESLLHIYKIPDLIEVSTLDNRLTAELNELSINSLTAEEEQWLQEFSTQIEYCSETARKRISILEELNTICNELADMEYEFLYDRTQHLLTIGYNADEHRRDLSFYDLLASEARLTTFVGISQGKLPQESWFALGRQLTNAGGDSVLLSWSGSMFEYLMPLLYMPTYENTLLHQTYKVMVQRQVEYGRQLGVPWGISESGYNQVDTSLNLQYRAFGVPELGLKRGLSEDLVIAPYATMMALMVDPEEAYKNLQQLSEEEFEGRFGYYEAIDYTPSRVPRGQTNVPIRSFMAHHQGMSLLSLAYLLLDRPMQKRFESEPQFQATLLLLQERIPKATKFFSPPPDVADINVESGETDMRIINNPDTIFPEVQLLSNGNYHVMVTHAGGGYSRWKNIAVSRWREDVTCDNWGNFCFIRDLEKGNFWSTAHQPAVKQATSYQAVFSQGRAEFRRLDNDIETHTEIAVSPEDDVEIRRIHITNRSRKRRSIELTSYVEIVLTAPMADVLHPAFSNLFVQTEIIAQKNAIICTRRPRSADERPPWMFHLMKTNSGDVQTVSYETDRMKFIGRGNSIANPLALNQELPLSGTEGAVLDPIVSIQYRLAINPMETVTVDIVYGIGDSRDICELLIEKYQDPSFIERAFELSWTHSQMVLRQINATESDAQLYSRMAGSVVYNNSSLRAEPAVVIKNNKGQSGLWSYSISGDLPIVLLQIADLENISIVKQLVQAHAYWRLKGLIVDLVIWNEDYGGYRQVLQSQLLGLISAGQDIEATERPGGIFVRITEQIAMEDRILIQSVARMVLSDTKGSLISQISKRAALKTPIPHLIPKEIQASYTGKLSPVQGLDHYNGLGGFSQDGKEYIINSSLQHVTPLPWVNVIANPKFGTVVSESGQAYTWVENAHEFRLTPWNNDAVSDASGETFYIRDEESGKYWSPAFLPCRGRSAYVTHHGFGYSRFEHIEEGIGTDMTVYVDIEATVKFTVIKIRNLSNQRRRLSVTGYVEWVLGDIRSKSSMHILTETDATTGAIFARNQYNKEFNDRICFFDVSESVRTFSADRMEFIGRNGSLQKPDAMGRIKLSGRYGAAIDSCGALQAYIDLEPDQEHEVVFLLGTGDNKSEAVALVQQFGNPTAAANVLEKIKTFWQQTLGGIQVNTTDSGLNMIANGWLMYQTLACRFFARSGYYQSGGAFGYRDQLQDAMTIIHTKPQLVHDHILLCATRQFKEGDVQHWWHPPTGRGVRTRCSDDFLWLPYATCRYVDFTGDIAILHERASFLEGRPLNPDEESYYDLPGVSNISESLFEHCNRAIKHGMKYGTHGLPLIGSGDWNDGMDKVGYLGTGESVWLGFFLYDILIRFSKLCDQLNEPVIAENYRKEAETLKENIERTAWDGAWYRRAYFDNGTPLGSAKNMECSIDSIAQSWSVLSGAGNAERVVTAMDSAYNNLVRKESGLIQLLDPPFDKSELNPGYIKGYVPGVRENGGQYTHAAIWLVMAFARLKNKEKTRELLQMINPVYHGSTQEQIEIYKGEPYVVAADVYSVDLHIGRAGWTWYTGSAGWMYRLMIESIIGLNREADTLRLDPCIPVEWSGLTVQYRYKDTVYAIKYVHSEQTNLINTLTVDGIEQPANLIALVDDHLEHYAEMYY